MTDFFFVFSFKKRILAITFLNRSNLVFDLSYTKITGDGGSIIGLQRLFLFQQYHLLWIGGIYNKWVSNVLQISTSLLPCSQCKSEFSRFDARQLFVHSYDGNQVTPGFDREKTIFMWKLRCSCYGFLKTKQQPL